MNEEMKLTDFSVIVPIYKQNHKFIISKGGENIKMKQTLKNKPAEEEESDVTAICGPKEDVMKAKKDFLEISNEKQLVGHIAEIKANPEQHKFLIALLRTTCWLEMASSYPSSSEVTTIVCSFEIAPPDQSSSDFTLLGDSQEEPLFVRPDDDTEERRERIRTSDPSFMHGMDILRGIYTLKMLGPGLEQEISTLYENIHLKKYFVRERHVRVLGVACLVHTLKSQGEFVSIGEMRLKANCSRRDLVQFFGFVKLYCSYLDDSVPIYQYHNFSDDPRISNAAKHLESSVRKVITPIDKCAKHPNFHGTNEEFISRTLDLVKLAHSCWVTADRPLKGIIIACAYFCYVSMCHVPIFSLKRFCRDFDLSFRKAEERHKHVKKMLLTLGRKIPLNPGIYVDDTNIHRHLEYILKNCDWLRRNVMPDIRIKNEFFRKEFILYRMDLRDRRI
ncbi:vigilin [Nephila pilipes]|uniref:Vigilin n=1 Tax=Nephila pilipes TaxID=299642 RepID=A0A8X6Q110_NEPPI|nr:vigilin [Nephila pilipes]